MFIKQLAIASFAMAGMACAQNSVAVAQTTAAFIIDSPAGYALAGEIHYPDHVTGQVPIVVLISGSGGQDRHAELFDGAYSSHRQWYDIFNAAGFAVLSFDETGNGDSGGSWIEMGLSEHRDNVAATIAHARTQSRIDSDQVYALGHSEGGLIISMLSNIDTRLAGLIYVAGPGTQMMNVVEYQTDEMARAQIENPEEFETVRAQIFERFLGQINGIASLREGLELDPLGLAGTINAPALVLQGASDWQVLAEQADALAAAIEAGGQDVEVQVFTDVNHLMINDPTHSQDYDQLTDLDLDPRVTARAVSWLARQYAHRS